jgi:hypothetical protein
MLLAGRLGTSVSDLATEAMTQALRVNDMGSDLVAAVDMYELVNIHKGAGLVNLPRNSLNQLIASLDDSELDKVHDKSIEAGRWYAAYISSKMTSESILPFLENDFMIFWNLDEVEILEQDVMISFRATCFNMSTDLTNLLVLYTKGVFEELGYEVNYEDILPGLISIKFLKTLN